MSTTARTAGHEPAAGTEPRSAPPAAGASRRGRVPTELACLLGAVLLLALSWSLLVPPWQVPDEDHHFAYVQSLVERGALPGGDTPEQSTEQRQATSRSNAEQTAQVLATKLEWSSEAYERWRRDSAALPAGGRSDGGGSNPASTNPPVYYGYASVGYLAASGGDIFDRLYAMRALSALLLLVTVTAAWLLAGELFGPRRELQLAVAAVAGLQPMVVFVSSSVNPDALLYAAWALILWLGVRIVRRGLTLPTGAAFFAVLALGALTKATTLVLVPAALFVLAAGLRRRGTFSTRRIALSGLGAVAALVALAGGWVLLSQALGRPALFQVGDDSSSVKPSGEAARLLVSYLWQFYLPKLPFMQEFTGFPDLPVYDVWLKQGWGSFGSLEVELPEPVYVALAALVVGVLAAALVALLRARRRGSLDLAVLAFFVLAGGALLAGLHWVEYRTLLVVGAPFNQGRYLLPLVPLFGVALAAALTLVGPRLRGPLLGVALGGLMALQLLSLAVVASRFYA